MSGISCPPYDSWSFIASVGELVSSTLELGLQSAVIFSTLRSAAGGANLNMSNGLLIGLSLAPLGFDIAYEKLLEWFPPSWRHEPTANYKEMAESETLRGFAEGQHREELRMFNLKPYILKRWDELSRKRTPQRMSWNYNAEFYLDIVRLSASELITNLFYVRDFRPSHADAQVLLAVRAIPSTMTLGAIHLHKRSAESFHSTISRVSWKLQASWQLPYFLAAVFAAQDGPTRSGVLDYAKHRRPNGMRIEARKLGLTYPGASEPTLRDINLTVEAGE